MRKFWVILLSMGLIMALAMPVGAADVKFSGSYVAQGYYESNAMVTDPDGGSSSFGWQRLRLNTTFQVAEGLKLITQADIMEKIWGAARTGTATWNPVTSTGGLVGLTSPSGSTANAEMENIKFTETYVDFAVPGGNLGAFRVGYQTQGRWAYAFGDNGENDYGLRLRYDYGLTGPLWVLVAYDKIEGTKTKQNYAGIGESEDDKYHLGLTYIWTGGKAGALFTWFNYSSTANSPTTGFYRKMWAIQPNFNAKLGPVFVEAEGAYLGGKFQDPVNGTAAEIDQSAWRAYVKASVDLAPAYVGALAFYSSGDDDPNDDERNSGMGIGTDFSPCQILMNYDLGRWSGNLGKNYVVASHGTNMDNVWAVQVFGGVKPIPKLDLFASVTYASLVEDPYSSTGTKLTTDKDLGWEVDLTATYKIYDNLSYMIGFGYLFAGDAFKGTSTADTDDNYLVTHKLTLTF